MPAGSRSRVQEAFLPTHLHPTGDFSSCFCLAVEPRLLYATRHERRRELLNESGHLPPAASWSVVHTRAAGEKV